MGMPPGAKRDIPETPSRGPAATAAPAEKLRGRRAGTIRRGPAASSTIRAPARLVRNNRAVAVKEYRERPGNNDDMDE